jgi:hypothetical protein
MTMIKILISLALLLFINSCENNSKSNIQSANSNLKDTRNNLYIKDSLDTDTSYTTISFFKDDSVNLFFRNADDTLWNYVRRAHLRSKKQEIFSIDSFKSILNKAEFEFYPCEKAFCGYKKEFNKRYRFQLRIGKEIKMITVIEFWFNGESYMSPETLHIY